jgi:chromosome segregation ATPase
VETHQLPKDVIRHQTAAIEATQNELQEVKHGQHLLQDQNDKFQKELKTLREQIAAEPSIVPTRSWAEIAAGGDQGPSKTTPRQAEKESNCVRISTQRTFVDPSDNENSEGNTFAR